MMVLQVPRLVGPFRRRTAVVIVSLICCVTLSACNEKDEVPEKIVATEQPRALPDWLTVKDHIDPAVWLRGREIGHSVLPRDPEVDRARRALHQTSARFFEDPRMVANRTAQTGLMLAESGNPERFIDIMTGLVDVADVTANKKLYGEMCQHYLNLRKTGKDRSSALQALMTAYKAGGALPLWNKSPKSPNE